VVVIEKRDIFMSLFYCFDWERSSNFIGHFQDHNAKLLSDKERRKM
jgi:hypothetical protein